MDLVAHGGSRGGAAGASYVHWDGVLVFLPGPGNRTAVVIGPGAPGTLIVQPGVYEEQWVPEAGASGQAVEAAALRLVLPSKKDRVRIVGEADQQTTAAMPGVAGSLIGIDGADGIVKVRQ